MLAVVATFALGPFSAQVNAREELVPRDLLTVSHLDDGIPTGSPSTPGLAAGGTFTDDDGSIFEPSIEAIAAAGITKGCNPPLNDRFCPAGTVTRGQMAAFIVRARSLPAAPPGNRFVDDDSIFEGDIARLAAAGITKGCNPPTNNRFCPDRLVTRAEMAAFLVRSYGYGPAGAGNRFVDDDGSVFEDDIARLAAAGITKGCNPPANDRFCPSERVRRDQMAAFLQRAEGLDPIEPPPGETPTLTAVATGLSSPIHVTAPPGDQRLFIAEKGGRIRILTASGVVRSRPFLDLSSQVVSTGERGLLGLAFHPGYATPGHSGNGRFFVAYSIADRPTGCPSDPSGCHTTVLAEYRVSGDANVANPAGTELLRIPQPYSNHNGGHIEFGPDGRLYIGVGDGGGSNDPGNGAQTTTNLLGSILRIGVDQPGSYTSPPDNPFVGVAGRNEIWVYGLRNPWRFAFDHTRLFIGDVGQGAWEEINVIGTASAPGVNFGWRMFEADTCTGNGPNCTRTGLRFPVHRYPHPEGCSVTGGRVYRGPELPKLAGHYFYGDYCAGWVRSFRMVDGKAAGHTDWTDDLGTVPTLASFGEGGDGGLYLVSIGGTVYRLEAK